MEDFRLPASLVGLLKLSKLKGIPEFDICHKTDSVEVTIYWKKATPAASKKNSMTISKDKVKAADFQADDQVNATGCSQACLTEGHSKACFTEGR